MSVSDDWNQIEQGIGIGHKLAPEIWDEASGHYLLQVNEDGSHKCADDCEPCLAVAAELARLRAAHQTQQDALRAMLAAPLPRKTDSAEKIAEMYAAARLAVRVVLDEWDEIAAVSGTENTE